MAAKCWQCGRRPEEGELLWGGHLLPRSARSGGPILLLRCPGCGTRNLVERNSLGQVLLSPPLAAGHGPPDQKKTLHYAARRWLSRHALARREFLERTAGPPGPLEGPSPAAPSREEASPPLGSEDGPPSRAEGPPPRGTDDAGAADLAGVASLLDAYDALDLPLIATDAEIRTRYRELAMKCHPDRVSGLDEEIRSLAERKFLRLQAAFRMITDREDGAPPSGSS